MLFCMKQTYSSCIEDGRQNQHDVVRPVLFIDSHFILLDHQDMQVRGSIHCMVQVKQTVLMTPCGWGEDWTLDAVWALQRYKELK